MGFIKNIFSPRKQDFDFSKVAVDIHSHLIPGLDDGVKTTEEAISLIKAMYDLGYRKLITTPHIMADYFKNTRTTITTGLEKLKSHQEIKNLDIQLHAAAEYMIDDGFEKLYKSEPLLTIADEYVLIELSTLTPPYNFENIIFDLQIAGYKVILAHPERYSYWYQSIHEFEKLKNRDVLFQLNLVSLSGFYHESVKRFANKLIDNGYIDFLGSDLHNHYYLQALQGLKIGSKLNDLIDSGKIKNKLLV